MRFQTMPQFTGKRSADRSVKGSLLILVVVAFGVVGYSTIEHWSLPDSLYMTIITLATVGYSEVHQLSPAGRLFTSILIVCGVSTAAYAFTTLTQKVVEGELNQLNKFRKMEKRIAALRDHTIVCGYGRLARIVVKELLDAHEEVVVIENSAAILDELLAAEILFVEGSAYDDDVLRKAGITTAKNLLALLPLDSDNVYITLAARELNPSVEITARTEGEASENRLRRAGASVVIAPYRVAGVSVVQKLVRPHVSEFLQIASKKTDSPLLIEELTVPEGSSLAGKTLEECALPTRTGAMVAAIIDKDGRMAVNPGPKSVIEPEATMIVIGKPGSIDKLSALL